MYRTKKYTVLLALGIVLGIGCTGCGKKDAGVGKTDYLVPATESTAVKEVYNVNTVNRGDFYDEYEHTAQLYIPERKPVTVKYKYGKCEFVDFAITPGTYVNKGDAIAYVHIEVSEADIEKERIALTRMEERLEQDIKDYEDIDKYVYSKAYGKHDSEFGVALREHKESVEAHKQDIEQRRTMIAEQRELIAKMEYAKNLSELVAPTDGYVKDMITIKRGEEVKDNTTLAVVTPKDTNIILVPNENNVYRYGKNVEVSLVYDGEKMEGTGVVISPSASTMQGNMDSSVAYIRLEIPGIETFNEDTTKSIKVKVRDNEMKDVLILPRGSLEESGTTAYATVITPDGSYVKRGVVIGKTGKKYYWILSGLNEGEQVVVP